MNFMNGRRVAGVVLIAFCLVLSACANLDRNISVVNLKPGAKQEPITSLALVFISPDSQNKDPGLVQGYRIAGVLNEATMRRTTDRAAEFLTLNGLQTKYAGSFGRSHPLGTLLNELAGKGYNTLVFVPTGASVTTQGGLPVSASVRYRATLYDRQLKPVLEMFDDYQAHAVTSNLADTAAAGWMNALVKSGYAVKKSDKFVQPPYRNFLQEDNGSKASGK